MQSKTSTSQKTQARRSKVVFDNGRPVAVIVFDNNGRFVAVYDVKPAK